MTPESPVIAELRGLLDALCEESIAPEQVRRLEELVLAHPEAEAYYVRFMSFYADLVQTVAGLPARAEQLVRDRADPPAPTETAPPPARHRRTRRAMLVGAALAASVLLALAYFARPRPNPQRPNDPAGERTDDTVAVLIQSHKAVWDETGMPTRPGSPLAPGRLVLKTGFAQIEFYNGATVILEGPAEFQLVSRTEGFCAHGKLRATVPPQAHGFRIGSPALNVVDRGTEFGLNVGGEKTAVHVFKGEVHLFDPGAAPTAPPRTQLKTGDAVSLAAPGLMSKIDPTPTEFLTAGELTDRTAKEIALRQKEWQRSSAERRTDPSLLVYYAFGSEDTGTRTLLDVSRGRNDPRDGALVGCSWGTGRWRGREGIEFKRMSDRVRLNVPGEFASLTFAAWVRPDALPNVNNSLLMSDGWEEGECHWQIGSDGTLILGIKGTPDYKPEPNVRGPQYRAYGAITPDLFGRWIHLAVTYDREHGLVTHFVDGRSVAQSAVLLDLPLRIGAAELGNWNPDGYRVKTPIRNFTGGIDEFMLFNRALDAAEVERLYTQGRPPL